MLFLFLSFGINTFRPVETVESERKKMDVPNIKDDPEVSNLVDPNEKGFDDMDKMAEREERM